MKLNCVKIQNYKRFEQPIRLDTRGPVIAIIGPNEAGKTSLLEAIHHLTSSKGFEQSEYTTRNSNRALRIEGHYALEKEDEEVVRDLLPSGGVNYILTQEGSSDTSYSLRPAVERNKTQRHEALALLDRYSRERGLDQEEVLEDENAVAEVVRELISQLDSGDDYLTKEGLHNIRALIDLLEDQLPEEGPAKDGDPAEDLIQQLRETLAEETQQSPTEKILSLLEDRVPKVRFFTEEQRTLESEYTWADLEEAPAALSNLLSLAGASYAQYKFVAQRKDSPGVAELEESAQAKLDKAFRVWSQGGIHVGNSMRHSGKPRSLRHSQ